MIRVWREFRLLFVVQMLEQREWWMQALIITTAFPLLMVFGLGYIGSGQSKAGLAYIITGSTVVSLTTVGIVIVASELAVMKEQGYFLYYASLPISKTSLLLAVIAAKLLLQLPGVVVALVGGSLIYGFHISPNPLILVILPLTALALSGIGAALGILLPGAQAVNVVGNAVIFMVLFLAPVLIPIARLPLPLQWLGMLMPPTYSADALRRLVTGVTDLRVMIDLAVLTACGVVSLGIVTKYLRWRLS